VVECSQRSLPLLLASVTVLVCGIQKHINGKGNLRKNSSFTSLQLGPSLSVHVLCSASQHLAAIAFVCLPPNRTVSGTKHPQSVTVTAQSLWAPLLSGMAAWELIRSEADDETSSRHSLAHITGHKVDRIWSHSCCFFGLFPQLLDPSTHKPEYATLVFRILAVFKLLLSYYY